jgi:cytochrome P450
MSEASDGVKGACPFADDAAILARGTLADPVIQADPSAFFGAMRRNDPVHYDEKLGMWLVSRHDDIVEVLRDPITYSDKLGYEHIFAGGFFDEYRAIMERDGGGFFPGAIKDDPPAHTRIRSLAEKAFTAHRVATLEPGITAVIVELVESLAEKAAGGRVVDGAGDFAIPLTIRVICEQLGVSASYAKSIQRWSSAATAQISAMQDREMMLANAQQMCAMQQFIIAEMKAREAEPREDMISDIVHATLEDGGKLEFGEAVSLIQSLIIAGNDTTATAIGKLLFLLATQPEVLATLQASVDDDRLMTRFVEELLRIEPPVRGLAKMAVKEVELGGTKLPAHAHLLVLYASGNDDETVFPCPRAFDLNRSNLGKHVAFGVGVHRCIGASLARMEIKVAAREVVRRLADIRLAVPVEELRFLPTVATHTIAELPLTLARRREV